MEPILNFSGGVYFHVHKQNREWEIESLRQSDRAAAPPDGSQNNTGRVCKKLSQNGLPIHEKEIKEIEAGQRAVTDIELKSIAVQLYIFAYTLLIYSKDTFSKIAPVPGNRFACCADCRHFLQHYIKNNGVLTAVNCGHCIYAGARRKLPLNADCPYFEAAEVKQTEMLQVDP